MENVELKNDLLLKNNLSMVITESKISSIKIKVCIRNILIIR
jgi:hypothetical protein